MGEISKQWVQPKKLLRAKNKARLRDLKRIERRLRRKGKKR